jgi:hypothetical protein
MLVKSAWKNNTSKFSRNKTSWKSLTILLDINNSLLIYSKLPFATFVILLQSSAAATRLFIRTEEA